MHVELSDHFMNYIQAKVGSGLYNNGAEVIRDALRRMMEHEQQDGKLEQLRAALQVGLDQIERGETVAYTPELREQIKQNAIRKAKAGHKPNPNLLP